MAKIIVFVLLYAGLIWNAHSDPQWQSPYYIDHPLVGKIFSLRAQRWVTFDQVVEETQAANLILLGEIHTNPDHHLGQARFIQHWLKFDHNIAVVFEMIDFDRWQQANRVWADAAGLEERLKEIAEQWDWPLYRPILEQIVKNKLPVYAANLNELQRRQIGESDRCELQRYDRSIRICNAIKTDQVKVIEQLIEEAHCGYLQSARLSPLAKTQIAKDAAFALSLLEAGSTHRAVLIAGTVHVRKDIGVPVHLKKFGKESVSIAFLSVDPEQTRVEDYIDRNSGQIYDFVYFTPSERNQDPCVEFSKQLEKLKVNK